MTFSRISFNKPAIALAGVAVFFSLGGGAYAAKKHYVLSSTKQVSPKVLKALKGNGAAGAAGATGAAGAAGTAGAKGATGDAGAKGDTGAAGSARAYALVNTFSCTNNVCPIAKSKGVAEVRRTAIGQYCVSLSVPGDQGVLPAFVGVEWRTTNTPEGNTQAMVDGAGNGCEVAGLPNAFGVVTTRTPGTGSQTAGAAAITTAVLSNDVGFWVMVP